MASARRLSRAMGSEFGGLVVSMTLGESGSAVKCIVAVQFGGVQTERDACSRKERVKP